MHQSVQAGKTLGMAFQRLAAILQVLSGPYDDHIRKWQSEISSSDLCHSASILGPHEVLSTCAQADKDLPVQSHRS